MKMKKILSLILVLAFTLTMLTACKQDSSSKDSVTGAPDDTSTETNADRENVNIRFAQFGNSVDDVDGMENDPIKKAIEDAVNVTVEYDTGSDGFDERMQTELFTGGAPDLFPTWGESDKISKWVEDELVVNISKIVNADPERYPTLYKIINSDEYKAYNKMYTGDADNAYAIYGVAAFADPAFSGVPVYNQAILDQVNSGNAPKTVDEFLTYASAAGQAGYVGWWPRNDKLTNWNEIDKTLAAPQGTTIMAPTGDAWTGFTLSGDLGTDSEYWTLATTSDKSKEVVKQLAELYKTGGLDSNIGVKGDFDDAYSDFGAGKIGAINFGFGYPGQFKDFYTSCWLAANPSAAMSDLTLGTALTQDGKTGTTYTTGTWIGSHYFIPTSCKNPERVLDLVEFIASSDGQDLLQNTVDGTFDTSHDSDYWNNINKAYGYGTDGRCKYVWFSYMFCGTEYRVDFENNSWWEAVSNPVDYSNEWATEQDAELTNYAKGIIDTFVDTAVTTLPAYYNLISLPSEASDIRTKLSDITNSYLTQMLGGQMDIDANWDKYVSEYEAAGAKDLEAMLNEAVATARDMK
jgi:maltose-binding protein MalE